MRVSEVSHVLPEMPVGSNLQRAGRDPSFPQHPTHAESPAHDAIAGYSRLPGLRLVGVRNSAGLASRGLAAFAAPAAARGGCAHARAEHDHSSDVGGPAAGSPRDTKAPGSSRGPLCVPGSASESRGQYCSLPPVLSTFRPYRRRDRRPALGPWARESHKSALPWSATRPQSKPRSAAPCASPWSDRSRPP